LHFEHQFASDHRRQYLMKMTLTKTLLCIVFLVLTGCSTTASKIERSPEIGATSIASIGDPIYRFSAIERLTIDHYSGQSYGGQGQTKELLYSGVSNGQLRLTYREFAAQAVGAKGTSNYARPAYTQDVQYDYTGGKTDINFQSVQIEVFSADSKQIEYVVKNGFRDESEIAAAAECSDKKWADQEAKC